MAGKSKFISGSLFAYKKLQPDLTSMFFVGFQLEKKAEKLRML